MDKNAKFLLIFISIERSYQMKIKNFIMKKKESDIEWKSIMALWFLCSISNQSICFIIFICHKYLLQVSWNIVKCLKMKFAHFVYMYCVIEYTYVRN